MYCPGCTEHRKRPDMKKCGGCGTFYCNDCLNDHIPCTSTERAFNNPPPKIERMKRGKVKTRDTERT